MSGFIKEPEMFRASVAVYVRTFRKRDMKCVGSGRVHLRSGPTKAKVKQGRIKSKPRSLTADFTRGCDGFVLGRVRETGPSPGHV